MLKERRLAFDARLETPKTFAQNLASLAIETNDTPVEQRVTPFYYEIQEDKVAEPQTGKDIIELCSADTELDELSTQAAIQFKEHFLTHLDDDGLAVWISPPNPYPEGRIVVGIKRGIKIECYGIPVNSFEDPEYIEVGGKVATLSKKSHAEVIIDELRGTTFYLDKPEGDEFDFFASLIPLPDVWKAIKAGKPQQVKEQAVRAAKQVSESVLPLIHLARTDYDYLYSGAMAEKMMMEAGWSMKTQKFGCGISNLEMMEGYEFTYYQMDSSGIWQLVKSEAGWTLGVCRICKKTRSVGECSICEDCEKTA